VLWQLCQPGA